MDHNKLQQEGSHAYHVAAAMQVTQEGKEPFCEPFDEFGEQTDAE